MPDLFITLPDGKVVRCGAAKAEGTLFGRDPSCEVVLSDPSVSSRHMRVFATDGVGDAWFVRDLDSRNGVTVNDAKIARGVPVAIRLGDRIGVGSGQLRVGTPNSTLVSKGSVQLVEGQAREAVPSSSLVLGMSELEHISRVSAASSREELCEELLSCAITTTGFSRGAIAQLATPDQPLIDLVATRTALPYSPPVQAISRSLVALALAKGAARFDVRMQQGGASLQATLTQDACAVRLSAPDAAGLPGLVLYLDSRLREPRPRDNALDIAAALASVAASCLGRLSAAELRQKHAALHSQLQGAREMQQGLMPPGRGELLGGALRYELLSLPGLMVAGDIADVLDLGGRCALIIGDVMGKGARAGMLMAAVQARLAQGLSDGIPLDRLIAQLNQDVCTRCPGMMLSLWAGVIEAATRRLVYVDAGHGMAFRRTGAAITTLAEGGGPVLGAMPEAPFEAAAVDLAPGDRLLLFTDGVSEQPDPDGEQFDMRRVQECYSLPREGLGHLAALHEAVTNHARGAVQHDDLTIMAAELV